ncbi:hypothetical protein [Prevotella sp. 10(H)]|uniref:hypothetical protein n=1 Tax=Prevotella sp. 10(H) TaxID=1158294 RepID=UPI00056506D2|nr:hypothetical protein [Prevotella sp. 10(H)]
MKVPVLFVIFNRPDLALETFQSIKQYSPEVLYIAADGPRPNREKDLELCQRTRDLVLNSIDWDCDVLQLFREENVGCGRGVSEAISWMFEKEEYGIIIEDDCTPSLDFFAYCEELLPKYRNEEKVMQINGFNPNAEIKISNTYSFSRYPKIWGWGTWKRAWDKYDFYMKNWTLYKEQKVHYKIFSYFEAKIHEHIWDSYQNELEEMDIPRTWDIQWSIAVFFNNGLCIVPAVNLVKNTGIEVDATNCSNGSVYQNAQYGRLEFPLIHPTFAVLDQNTNKRDSKAYMRERTEGLKNKIKNILRFKR